MWVVEVRFEVYSRIGFFLWSESRTEVNTVVLCTGLEHESFWGYGSEFEGLEEVGEEGD